MAEDSKITALPRSGSDSDLAVAVSELHKEVNTRLSEFAKVSEESRMLAYTNHLASALQLLDPDWYRRIGSASPGGSSPGGSSPGGSSPGGSSPGGSSPGGSSPGESGFRGIDYVTDLRTLGVLFERALDVLRVEVTDDRDSLRQLAGLQEVASQLAGLQPERFSKAAGIGATSPFEDRGRPLKPTRTDAE